jgi:membrane associated rhomboid family serine protease
MNESIALCTMAIIVVTVACSWMGFRDPEYREKHLFSVRHILAKKQYSRLYTSALLHADWNHLWLNMLSLFLFGRQIELFLGPGPFLLVYLAAVIGGSLLALFIHRHHEYRAYGASGGVCGIIFSYIVLMPGANIVMFPVPIPIPAWLYAILFMVGSFLALRRQNDNIGHDAHLGGAIIGLWTTVVVRPEILRYQPKLFLAVFALASLLFLYLAGWPLFLPLSSLLPDKLFQKWKSGRSQTVRQPEIAVDAILEKIANKGIESLTVQEKALLNAQSGKYQRRSDSKKPKSELLF